MAAQLRRFGVRFRIIDRLLNRARESRALGVQARTLEVFQILGIADTLVSRGNTTARVNIHVDDRDAIEIQLGNVNAADTRFPFILFVSQAETEAVLSDHLQSTGVMIERGVELTHAHADASGVTCVLRHADGRREDLRVSYVLGCDGAHSMVRRLADIAFEGAAYPQDFVLGDVEVDGPLRRDTIHAFPRGPALAIFFPLGQPRSWRVIAMAPNEGDDPDRNSEQASLSDLQSLADAATNGAVRLHDPAWVTHFRLHHRQTRHYRAGPMFLAGDAAHIHSPVGAQGMNTGIQDAWNLGWKIALVTQGLADVELLDTYEAERWPIGRFLLRVTDRAFTLVTRSMASGTLASWTRRVLVPKVLSRVGASTRLRTVGFRFVSELDIRYRSSPLVLEGSPRLNGGPRAGDRLPDIPLLRHGHTVYLHDALSEPCFHLLLCGAPDSWDEDTCAGYAAIGNGHLVTIHHIVRHGTTGDLVDESGDVFAALAVPVSAQYLVRPDGYIAYRCAGPDLRGVGDYLAYWLRHPPA